MSPRPIRTIHVLALLLSLMMVGCGRDKNNPTKPVSGVVPDFSLTDVNPNSASAGQAVSPRQQLDKISAWYFGHAT